MTMNTALWGGGFFLLGVLLQYVWIGVQRRLSVVQAQKSYGIGIDVEIKAATPPMGGCVFLVLALLALVPTWGEARPSCSGPCRSQEAPSGWPMMG